MPRFISLFLLLLLSALNAYSQVPAKAATVESEAETASVNSSIQAAALDAQRRRSDLRTLLKTQQSHGAQIDPRRLTPPERVLLRQQLQSQQVEIQQVREQQLQAQQLQLQQLQQLQSHPPAAAHVDASSALPARPGTGTAP